MGGFNHKKSSNWVLKGMIEQEIIPNAKKVALDIKKILSLDSKS